MTRPIHSGNTRIAVINVAAAKRFWPGENALGKTFRPFPKSLPITVIGIVADVPESVGAARIAPFIYLPSNLRPRRNRPAS